MRALRQGDGKTMSETAKEAANTLVPKVLPLPELTVSAGTEKPAPGSAEEIFRRGDARLTAGDVIGAIEDFSAVIELDARHRDAYACRGRASYGLKDYVAAIRDYTTALDLKPTASVYFNRALAKRDGGDLEGAKADFMRCPEEVFALAKARYGLSRYEETIEYLGSFLAADPGSRDAVEMRARAAQNLGRHDDAVRDFTRALEMAADPVWVIGPAPDPSRRSPTTWARLGDFDEAIKLRPDDKEYYWRRGLARESIGDAAGALADFTRSLGGPSPERKREIAAEIRRDRARATALGATGGATWLVFCTAFFLLIPKIPSGSAWGWAFLLGPIAYVTTFMKSLDALSSSKGRGTHSGDNVFLFALAGPVMFLALVLAATGGDSVSLPDSRAQRVSGVPPVRGADLTR